MTMTRTTKIVYSTKSGYDKEIEKRKAAGWQIVSEEAKPRGKFDKRLVYIAYLKRQEQ